MGAWLTFRKMWCRSISARTGQATGINLEYKPKCIRRDKTGIIVVEVVIGSLHHALIIEEEGYVDYGSFSSTFS